MLSKITLTDPAARDARTRTHECCASVIFGGLVFQLSHETHRVLAARRFGEEGKCVGVNLKMAWVTPRKISGILTISTALLTLTIANGDKILHDTKQGRNYT